MTATIQISSYDNEIHVDTCVSGATELEMIQLVHTLMLLATRISADIMDEYHDTTVDRVEGTGGFEKEAKNGS